MISLLLDLHVAIAEASANVFIQSSEAALKTATGRKGKALFMPLRLALTGLEHGPDMAALLPLIGREQALLRLRA